MDDTVSYTAADGRSKSLSQTGAVNGVSKNEKPKNQVLSFTLMHVIGILLIILFAVIGLLIGYRIGRRKGTPIQTPFDGKSHAVCQFRQPDVNGTLRIDYDGDRKLLNTSISETMTFTTTWLPMHYQLVVLQTTNLTRCANKAMNKTEILDFGPPYPTMDGPHFGRLATLEIQYSEPTPEGWRIGQIRTVTDEPPFVTMDKPVQLMGRAVAIAVRIRDKFDTKACCIIAHAD